jgi:ubiquitin-like protein ATG12
VNIDDRNAKVDVLLKAAGDAPILQRTKWSLARNKTIGFVTAFLNRMIHCPENEALFLYINQSFTPSPDTEIGVLYDCFSAEGILLIHYCKTQAWG